MAILLETEKWKYFSEGLNAVFRRWTALQLALVEEEQAVELFESTLEFFQDCHRDKEPIPFDSLEYNFYCWFEDELHCAVQDGSLIQVALDLISLYDEIMRGDWSMYSKLMAAQPLAGTQASKTQGYISDGDSSDNEMQEDSMEVDPMEVEPKPSKAEPIIDEDGFELVVKKRK